MKRLTLTALLLGSSVYGQQPTITGITIDSLDVSSLRIFYTVSGVPSGWAELFYGTSSGVYPYNTKTASCFNRTDACEGAGTTSLVLTGLKPGTTYYIRPTARPHSGDNTDICNTNACGAIEQVVTTLTGPVPAAPQAPTEWKPQLPDTSTYSIIPLEVGTTGECQAGQTVVSPDGWTVPAGTAVGTALNIVGYGTVFEVPQGTACKVPPLSQGVGYILPSKGLDTHCGRTCTMTDPNHRWIIFRTKQVTNGDFPAFGSRINSSYAPRLGKFYSSGPNHASQLFDAEAGINAIHHYWFQNVEFEDDPAYVNPADYTDPESFTFFARLGSTYQLENNQFMVLDRVYAHGGGAPIRHYQGYEIGGNYYAMIGCYTEKVESWRMTAWPSSAGSLQSNNTVLTIPKNNYRFSRSSATLGMTAGASAMLSGITGVGTVVGNLYKDHLEVRYTSGIGTLICSGCTALAEATPTTPPNAFQLFVGSITVDGKFSGMSWHTEEFWTSRYAMTFGLLTSDLKAPGGPYYIENNYIDSVGMGYYMDTQFGPYSNDDLTYTHNHHVWPKEANPQDTNNQWRYSTRQHWESKRLHRGVVQGNIFSRYWSTQNDGPGVLLSGRTPYLVSPNNKDGVSDIAIKSNIVSHGRSGIACMGGNAMDNGGNLPEPSPTKRVAIKNNLLFDLGQWLHYDPQFSPGLLSPVFMSRPGCQDLVIENNTAGPVYGLDAPILELGGGHTLGNYLSFRKNLVYVSRGEGGLGGLNWVDTPNNGVDNHPVKPMPVFDISGTQPDFKSNLDKFFVNIAATVTPSYSWGQNILVGSWKDTNQTFAGIAEMSFGEFQSYLGKRPAGDMPLPTGNSTAARGASAKLASPKTFNFRVTEPNASTPGGIGVNYEELYRDAGIVTEIEQPRVSASQVEFNYTAPDARACVVDVALASGSTLAWTRAADPGGARRRRVTVTGLNASSIYRYRIVCYFEQLNDIRLYNDYTQDQITSGVFSTASGEQASTRVPFVLASIPGAIEVRVTVTSLEGVATTQVCTSSPCMLTVDKGSYTLQTEFLNGGTQVLNTGFGHIIVR